MVPLLSGSGKSPMPWLRMHCEYASALPSTLADDDAVGGADDPAPATLGPDGACEQAGTSRPKETSAIAMGATGRRRPCRPGRFVVSMIGECMS